MYMHIIYVCVCVWKLCICVHVHVHVHVQVLVYLRVHVFCFFCMSVCFYVCMFMDYLCVVMCSIFSAIYKLWLSSVIYYLSTIVCYWTLVCSVWLISCLIGYFSFIFMIYYEGAGSRSHQWNRCYFYVNMLLLTSLFWVLQTYRIDIWSVEKLLGYPWIQFGHPRGRQLRRRPTIEKMVLLQLFFWFYGYVEWLIRIVEKLFCKFSSAHQSGSRTTFRPTVPDVAVCL